VVEVEPLVVDLVAVVVQVVIVMANSP